MHKRTSFDVQRITHKTTNAQHTQEAESSKHSIPAATASELNVLLSFTTCFAQPNHLPTCHFVRGIVDPKTKSAESKDKRKLLIYLITVADHTWSVVEAPCVPSFVCAFALRKRKENHQFPIDVLQKAARTANDN
jgi:hypothetical protein